MSILCGSGSRRSSRLPHVLWTSSPLLRVPDMIKTSINKLDKTSSSMSEWRTLFASLPKAEVAANPPIDDTVRPGRGLSLIIVVVASLTPDRGCPTEGTIDSTPGRIGKRSFAAYGCST